MSSIAVETNEIWKKHPVADERFMVSNTGKVMNWKRGKEMKLQVSKRESGGVQYPHFATKVGGRNGTNLCLRVHRLVAELFVPNPEDKPFVNHIDGDKCNNHYTNLEWCTAQENVRHAIDTGLLTYKRLPCGTAASYTRGCRCDGCKAAYSTKRREHYLRTGN